jgi:hypothetical protein
MDATDSTEHVQLNTPLISKRNAVPRLTPPFEIRENRSPKSRQITVTTKKLPTTNPTNRQIAATFTTVASEQIILIEKFTFSS